MKHLLWSAYLLVAALFVAGCGDAPPLLAPNVRDTTGVITPPDTTHHPCPTCPPDTCTTCPPDTTGNGDCTTQPTKGGKIHETKSHLTIARITTTATSNVKIVVPTEYETGKPENNERYHAYARLVTVFENKRYFTWVDYTGSPPTTVVEDPPGYSGWLNRTLELNGLPPGTYDIVLQQDWPDPNHPGESDIIFGAGTITVCQR